MSNGFQKSFQLFKKHETSEIHWAQWVHSLDLKPDKYKLGVDRLSAWPIIGADIKHFTDYRYRPF